MAMKIIPAVDLRQGAKTQTINELGNGLKTLNTGKVQGKGKVNLASLLRISHYTSFHCVQ